jgi:hypothetical protein
MLGDKHLYLFVFTKGQMKVMHLPVSNSQAVRRVSVRLH